MKHKVSVIMLRITRYSDRNDIALGLSREVGPVSFLVSAGSGRGAARRRALLMPMSIVGGELNVAAGRSVGTVGDLSALTVFPAIHANPVKGAVALFMADMLAAVVREGVCDPLLWDFAAASVAALERIPASRLANFPIVFAMRLADMLGIAPDSATYCRGRILDLRDGVYRATVPLHPDIATANESRIVALAGGLGYHDMHRLRLSLDDRRQLLDGVLRFITMHHARVDNLKSLAVLRSLG
ncbi:MAG: DNA repair protein RecO C-terminal domain-containing protein [Candidatus Amulumruptor sp.]|nr:DNA repair protein RecO C-terminal domain-containing protein [Candidatus Amulumruptor sp.]